MCVNVSAFSLRWSYWIGTVPVSGSLPPLAVLPPLVSYCLIKVGISMQMGATVLCQIILANTQGSKVFSSFLYLPLFNLLAITLVPSRQPQKPVICMYDVN